MRLAAALYHFWQAHTHFHEGRRWLEAGIARSDDVSVRVRMKALNAGAGLAMIQADQRRAVALAEEVLSLAQQHHDMNQERSALTLLGMTAVQQGDYRRATRHLEACILLAQAHGSRFNLAHSHYNLGLAKSEEGSYTEARKLIEEALTRLRDLGDMYWAMNAVGALGFIALLEGRYEYARGLLREYLETALRFQDKANIAAGLEGLAVVAVRQGSAEQAAWLFAAAESLRQEIGSRLMSLRNRTMIEHAVNSSCERLEEVAWLAAWEKGRGMTTEQAVIMAVEKGTDPETATV